jgi:hypothetical protein
MGKKQAAYTSPTYSFATIIIVQKQEAQKNRTITGFVRSISEIVRSPLQPSDRPAYKQIPHPWGRDLLTLQGMNPVHDTGVDGCGRASAKGF